MKIIFMPHWSKTAIERAGESLSAFAGDSSDVERIRKKIAGSDFRDIGIATYMMRDVATYDFLFCGMDIESYVHTDTNDLRGDLRGTYESKPYKIHNVTDDLIVVEMLEGFMTMMELEGSPVKQLYSNIFCEVLKNTSFCLAVRTNLFKSYLSKFN